MRYGKAPIEPDAPFVLAQASVADFYSYLRHRGLLNPEGSILEVGKAGDGNMNTTLRVKTTSGSFILKQSMPWVAKYPEIPAPRDRTLREARFYQMVNPYPEVSQMMPDLLALDVKNRIAVFSDLGAASDFTFLYSREELISAEHLEILATWLRNLHTLPFQSGEREQLTNMDMRLLNHEHLFEFPLNPANGMGLDSITPGLQDLANSLHGHKEYVNRVREIGRDIYLKGGSCLIHGDYFPGSLLRTPLGLRIIDPEFGFFGHAEFDAGVFAAHLILSHHGLDVVETWFAVYGGPAGFDRRLANQFIGIEIMRRLIGVAQLPLEAGLADKRDWLDLSRDLLFS